MPASVRRCCRPVVMIAKPALSKARDAAASSQSRPSSIMLITPAIWPCVRRSRLTTVFS